MDFLPKPLAWFSIFYLRVESKNCGRNSFFYFPFQNFFESWAKTFSDFWPKSLKKLSKLPSACAEEQFVDWIFFKKFLIVLDFPQNTLAWFSSFYLRLQSKNCGRNKFLFFFSEFFRNLSEKFFWLLSKKIHEVVKTNFCVSRGTICGLKYFLKFWIVLHFLQKPLAWFSNIYLRVQSENCGRNSFLIFLFRIFSEFERKIFQTFGQKTSKSCQNYLLRVQRNNLWLETFFKSFEALCIFCRNLWHGSQISIYVSRVKFAEDIVFLFSFLIFFRILSEKLFGLLADKRQEFVKTTFYVSRGTICALNFF